MNKKDPKKKKEKPPIEFYSYTQFNMYKRCPRSYYYKYIRRMESPIMPPLAFGISGHRAIEHNYKQKETSYVDESKSIMQDVFEASMKEQKDRVPWEDTDTNYIDERDKGIALIGEYRDTVSPNIQPLKTEAGDIVKIAGLSKPFMFKIDLIDKNYLIIDTKFAKRMPPEADIAYDMQLSGYAYSLLKLPKKQTIFTEEQYSVFKKQDRISLCLDIVNKTNFKYKRIKTTRAKESLQWYAFQIREIDRAIQNKIFYPLPTPWFCSRFCGYREVCAKER